MFIELKGENGKCIFDSNDMLVAEVVDDQTTITFKNRTEYKLQGAGAYEQLAFTLKLNNSQHDKKEKQ